MASRGGRKSAKNAVPQIDLSVIRQAIDLGVSGVEQIVKCMQSGTQEVQQLLTYECDIIYECKVCRSMFRGLVNLLAHKRAYCTTSYVNTQIQFISDNLEDSTVIVQPDGPPDISADKYELIGDAHFTEIQPKQEMDTNLESECKLEINDHIAVDDDEDGHEDKTCHYMDDSVQGEIGIRFTKTNMTSPKDAESQNNMRSLITSQLKDGTLEAKSGEYKFYTKVDERLKKLQSEKNDCIMVLQSIEGNSGAVYQVINRNNESIEDTDKGDDEEEMEKEEETVEEKSDLVTVEPQEAKGPVHMTLRQRSTDGEVSTPIATRLWMRTDCDVKLRTCLKCKTQYSSLKTLHFHMMSLHSEKRVLYPCIYCDSEFSQLWVATRHVMRTHKRSKEHIDKIKETLKKRSYSKAIEEIPISKLSVMQQTEHKKERKEPDFAMREVRSSRLKSRESDKFSESKSTAKTCQNLFICSTCGKAFGKQESLNRHSSFCLYTKQFDTSNASSKESGSRSLGSRLKRSSRNSDFPPKDIELNLNDAGRWSKDISPREIQRINGLIDEIGLQCLKCRTQYASISNLHRHAVRHLGWQRFKCQLCMFTSYNRSECKSHLRKVHPLKLRSIHTDINSFIVDLDPESVTAEVSLLSRVEPGRRYSGKYLLPEPTSNGQDRRSPGVDMVNIRPSSPAQSYNISTRKSPRVFDTKPYQLEDQMTVLATRSGCYRKPQFPTKSKDSTDDEDEEDDKEEEAQTIQTGLNARQVTDIFNITEAEKSCEIDASSTHSKDVDLDDVNETNNFLMNPNVEEDIVHNVESLPTEHMEDISRSVSVFSETEDIENVSRNTSVFDEDISNESRANSAVMEIGDEEAESPGPPPLVTMETEYEECQNKVSVHSDGKILEKQVLDTHRDLSENNATVDKFTIENTNMNYAEQIHKQRDKDYDDVAMETREIDTRTPSSKSDDGDVIEHKLPEIDSGNLFPKSEERNVEIIEHKQLVKEYDNIFEKMAGKMYADKEDYTIFDLGMSGDKDTKPNFNTNLVITGATQATSIDSTTVTRDTYSSSTLTSSQSSQACDSAIVASESDKDPSETDSVENKDNTALDSVESKDNTALDSVENKDNTALSENQTGEGITDDPAEDAESGISSSPVDMQQLEVTECPTPNSSQSNCRQEESDSFRNSHNSSPQNDGLVPGKEECDFSVHDSIDDSLDESNDDRLKKGLVDSSSTQAAEAYDKASLPHVLLGAEENKDSHSSHDDNSYHSGGNGNDGNDSGEVDENITSENETNYIEHSNMYENVDELNDGDLTVNPDNNSLDCAKDSNHGNDKMPSGDENSNHDNIIPSGDEDSNHDNSNIPSGDVSNHGNVNRLYDDSSYHGNSTRASDDIYHGNSIRISGDDSNYGNSNLLSDDDSKHGKSTKPSGDEGGKCGNSNKPSSDDDSNLDNSNLPPGDDSKHCNRPSGDEDSNHDISNMLSGDDSNHGNISRPSDNDSIHGNTNRPPDDEDNSNKCNMPSGVDDSNYNNSNRPCGDEDGNHSNNSRPSEDSNHGNRPSGDENSNHSINTSARSVAPVQSCSDNLQSGLHISDESNQEEFSIKDGTSLSTMATENDVAMDNTEQNEENEETNMDLDKAVAMIS